MRVEGSKAVLIVNPETRSCVIMRRGRPRVSSRKPTPVTDDDPIFVEDVKLMKKNPKVKAVRRNCFAECEKCYLYMGSYWCTVDMIVIRKVPHRCPHPDIFNTKLMVRPR